MQEPLWMWGAFLAIVLILLILDLGLFHKKEQEISVKQSLTMTGFYIFIAACFGLWIWQCLGLQSALDFYTGFLVEKSLSLDNIFVMSLIFSFFSIPLKYQHRTLFWGILGVIVLRGAMIGAGAQLVANFHWVLYIFSLFLIVTGIKMLFVSDKPHDLNDNIALKWMRRHLHITPELHGQKFIVRQLDTKTGAHKLFITPLFVALMLIECADIIFAVDSVPAVFTITSDAYIIYTSNIFAILGLRSLYFALAAVLDQFYYLKYSLAAVLIFIGSKLFIADIFGLEKIPSGLSLGVTAGILAFGVFYSHYKSKSQ